MPEPSHKPFRTSLEAAVAYLIGQGVIKRDADVVKAMNMSKGTFSAYKSGITLPSTNFVQQFEKLYGVNLETFQRPKDQNDENLKPNHNALNPENMNDCERAIIENGFLRTTVDDLRRELNSLERTIKDREEIIGLQRSLLGQSKANIA